MTHHMPTPHAPSDLHLPLSSFPPVPSIHASLRLTPTHQHTHPRTLILSPGVPLFFSLTFLIGPVHFHPFLPHAAFIFKSMGGELTMAAE